MDIAFPLQIGPTGRTVAAASDDHVRQMIEQLLFTRPGERVMQPTLGCGLLQLVFEPNSPEITAAVQMTVQASLQQWLSDVVRIDSLSVQSVDAELAITVGYVVIATGTASQATFTPGGTA